VGVFCFLSFGKKGEQNKYRTKKTGEKNREKIEKKKQPEKPMTNEVGES
jgi:hypothetical protein